MDIELHIGDWFEVSHHGGEGYCLLKDMVKIKKVGKKTFVVEQHKHEYTIEQFSFRFLDKELCEEKMRLIAEIHKKKEAYLRKDRKLVIAIEMIDDILKIDYHNGKYGERP
jgi:hypothetical protein